LPDKDFSCRVGLEIHVYVCSGNGEGATVFGWALLWRCNTQTERENELDNNSADTPTPYLNLASFYAIVILLVLSLGFLLGFFPGFLGEGGTFAAGIERGWKFALIFSLAITAGSLVHVLLKNTRLPEILKTMAMFMTVLAIMYASGNWNNESNSGPWYWNVLRGMGNGAIVGGVVHGMTKRKTKNRQPTQ
jgi:hypothetical protein